MIKRLLILVITALVTVSFFSCSSGKKNPVAGSENTTDISAGSTEISNNYNPKLEAIDGHGKVIKVLTRESAIAGNYRYEEIDFEKATRAISYKREAIENASCSTAFSILEKCDFSMGLRLLIVSFGIMNFTIMHRRYFHHLGKETRKIKFVAKAKFVTDKVERTIIG